MKLSHTILTVLTLTMSVAAQRTPCYAEHGGATFDGRRQMGSSGTVAIKIDLPQLLRMDRIELFTGEQTGRNRIALHDHDAVRDQPGTLLRVSTFQMFAPNFWQGAFIRPINAQGPVWVVWTFSGRAQKPTEGVGGLTAQPYRIKVGAGWASIRRDERWKVRFFCGPTKATYRIDGVACKGSNNKVPVLANGSLPKLGATFSVSVTDARPASSCFVVFGVDREGWGSLRLPYDMKPLGAPGCRIYTSQEVRIPMRTDSRGGATYTIAVPNDIGLIGTQFFNQYFIFDRAANQLGVVATAIGSGFAGL